VAVTWLTGNYDGVGIAMVPVAVWAGAGSSFPHLERSRLPAPKQTRKSRTRCYPTAETKKRLKAERNQAHLSGAFVILMNSPAR
jgi:hypothetical protein